jgi:large subunit ribosomal protein L21
LFAILETGGFQYRIAPGKEIEVPSMRAEVGDKVTLSKVLMWEKDGSCEIGKPALENVVAEAEVIAHGRYPKVLVQKFKRRKKYRRLLGHRTPYTRLKILSIAEQASAATAAE